jgi:hypothetical protein
MVSSKLFTCSLRWTVESGIYFHEHLLKAVEDYDLLKGYREMGGLCIEDDVLITSNGCENLTKVGNDVEWLEWVCSGEIEIRGSFVSYSLWMMVSMKTVGITLMLDV